MINIRWRSEELFMHRPDYISRELHYLSSFICNLMGAIAKTPSQGAATELSRTVQCRMAVGGLSHVKYGVLMTGSRVHVFIDPGAEGLEVASLAALLVVLQRRRYNAVTWPHGAGGSRRGMVPSRGPQRGGRVYAARSVLNTSSSLRC